MTRLTDFDLVERALDRANSAAGAAEGHGILCGLLCVQGRVDDDAWFGEVLGEQHDAGNLLAQDAVRVLGTLKDQTVAQLHDTDLGFELLLPDDSRDLRDRIDALAEWVQGFLLGFGLRTVPGAVSLPADVDELLADFVEITKVQAEGADGEEDEDFYMHIVEYVRMGVLLIYEELHPVQRSPRLQ
jgi:uncharacterized protein YgfB (UPF0149 family)